MALDDDSAEARRLGKTRRHFALKGLPHQVDTARLDQALRKADPETREALVELVRGQQGNFDHLTSEIGRFAKLLNESEADNAYIRDKLDPHDHGDDMMKNPARGADDAVAGKSYLRTFHFGSSDETVYVVDDAIALVPFWIGENVYVDAFKAEVDDIDVSVGQYIVLGIYNGDGPGGFPGSLMYEASPVAIADGIITVTLDLNLRRGNWYWAATTTDGRGTGSAYWKVYTQGSEGSGRSNWWPFPHLDTYETTSTGLIAYIWQDLATPWSSGQALPSNLTFDNNHVYGSTTALACSLRVP